MKRNARLTAKDREEALKDDFHLEGGTYGYDDEDDEWNDDEASWEGAEADHEDEATDVKDEGTAYLEFLQEEVCALYVKPCFKMTDRLPPLVREVR